MQGTSELALPTSSLDLPHGLCMCCCLHLTGPFLPPLITLGTCPPHSRQVYFFHEALRRHCLSYLLFIQQTFLSTRYYSRS